MVDTAAAADTDLSTSTTAEVNLQDLTFDSMGHVNANKAHKYQLPYNFGNITVGANTISPDNTFDTLTLIGDNWLQLTADANNDGITFTHNTPQTAATITLNEVAANNVTPAFGSTFNIDDWTFDANGHMAGGTKHTVTIPQGSYTNTPTNEGVGVITGLGFTPSNGAITSTSNYLGAITLGSYTAPTPPTGNTASDITTTTSLAAALSTLDARIMAEEEARATALTNAVTTLNAGKVDANDAIVPDTATKITYDAKGLVTAGEDLEWNDIKDLAIGKDLNNADISLDDLTKYLISLYQSNLTRTLESITITAPTTTTYTDGETLDLSGLEVTANYVRGAEHTSEILGSGYSVNPTGGSTLSLNDPTVAETITVTVAYQGKTDTFDITVNPVPTEPEEPEPDPGE